MVEILSERVREGEEQAFEGENKDIDFEFREQFDQVDSRLIN